MGFSCYTYYIHYYFLSFYERCKANALETDKMRFYIGYREQARFRNTLIVSRKFSLGSKQIYVCGNPVFIYSKTANPDALCIINGGNTVNGKSHIYMIG